MKDIVHCGQKRNCSYSARGDCDGMIYCRENGDCTANISCDVVENLNNQIKIIGLLEKIVEVKR